MVRLWRSDRPHLIVAVLYLGIVVLGFWQHLFPFLDGFPFPGDGLSNAQAWWHARHAILQGSFPIWTDLWYGGQYQFANPLWKGFYPPAWPLFIPLTPLAATLRIILVVHYTAAAVIAYWYTNRYTNRLIAVAFGLLWITALPYIGGRYEMVFAWPWLAIIAGELIWAYYRPPTFWNGIRAGGAVGMMLLAGSMYYAVYGSLLCIGIAAAAVTQKDHLVAVIKGGAAGGLVGVPHIIFSVLPVIFKGANRPPVGHRVTALELLHGLSGRVPGAGVATGEVWIPVGFPVLVLGVLGVTIAARRNSRGSQAWAVGIVTPTLIAIALAMGRTEVYSIPGVSMLRVASRANVIIAVCALVGTVIASREVSLPNSTTTSTIIIIGILLGSAGQAGMVWGEVDDDHVTLSAGDDVTEAIEEAGCDSVWLEVWTMNGVTPAYDEISYSVAKAGIPAQSTYYGQIGQKYPVRENGEISFDVLIIGRKLPESQSTTVPLHGQGSQHRGTIHTREFELITQIHTGEGPIYLYRQVSAC